MQRPRPPWLVTALKASGKRALRSPALQTLAVRAATWRGHDLVLVYHRIRANGERPFAEVTPSLERARLRAQLQALSRVGDIVDLARLLEPATDRRRPRFALTFDDDYSQHVAHALPVLRELDLRATFFLSGRVLHGLGSYWWERLEALMAANGVATAARALGFAATTAAELAMLCESDARARERLEDIAPESADQPLNVDGMRSLLAAGMTIGFHTLDHPLLPPLDDEALAVALAKGRAELEAVNGGPISLFAYPHGKADARVARAARAAGFEAAWTGWPRPHTSLEDHFLLGRWEPGPLEVVAFLSAVAVRLHRAAPRGVS